jgi:hypothetical protein
MEEKRFFKPGDFVKRNSKAGGFVIYEGNNISETACKRLTVVCEYDPEKYKMTDAGYAYVPVLDMGTNTKRCQTTIDTEKEDYWYSLCNEEEKNRAERVLLRYGYEWDAENLRMIDITTGEIVKSIKIPDDKYYGQIIKPMSDASKAMLKKLCVEKNKPSYPAYDGPGWDGYYED